MTSNRHKNRQKMRENLINMMLSIDKNAYVTNYKYIGFKCLFDTTLTNDDITKINEFCAKYNCRWVMLIVNGRYCLTILKK